MTTKSKDDIIAEKGIIDEMIDIEVKKSKYWVRAYQFWVGLNRKWKISIVVTLISWTIYFTSHLSWWKVLILNAIIIYGIFGIRKNKRGVDK